MHLCCGGTSFFEMLDPPLSIDPIPYISTRFAWLNSSVNNLLYTAYQANTPLIGLCCRKPKLEKIFYKLIFNRNNFVPNFQWKMAHHGALT